MKITLLGTGSPIPDPNRAGPCSLVQAGTQNLMIDCGRAAIMRLMAAGVFPGMVSTVLITHLHSDHITDLNDLVTTRWVMMPINIPLHVVGPVGTQQVVDAMLAMLELDMGYRLAHHEDLRANGPLTVKVTEVQPGQTLSIDDIVVTTHATDHAPVQPSIGYRIEHDGKVAALAGDTLPCPGLDDMCRNADVYVQTVIRHDLVTALAEMMPMGKGRLLDILDYHSTPEQAGDTAARNNVGTLMLTHYVPAMQPGQEDDWRAKAAERFSGAIVVGPDLTSVEI